jgi:hypothetical protein
MKKRKKGRSAKSYSEASKKGARTRAKMLAQRAAGKKKKKKVQQRPRTRTRTKTRTRKPKDPNIVHPGKDPDFVFPEENNSDQARTQTPQEGAIMQFNKANEG